MPLEDATTISQLVETNPNPQDPISDGDDHIRMIKRVLKGTFPNHDQPQAPITPPALAAGSIVHNNAGTWAEIDKITVDPDGNVVCENVHTRGNVLANSDERLKDVTGPLRDALDRIKNLDTFYYTPNDAGLDLGMADRKQLGISAQQLEAQCPELVDTADDYLRVDYSRLCVLLLAAVKELADKVENQIP